MKAFKYYRERNSWTRIALTFLVRVPLGAILWPIMKAGELAEKVFDRLPFGLRG